MDYVEERTPDGWKKKHQDCALEIEEDTGVSKCETLEDEQVRSTWTRLLKKVYEVEVFLFIAASFSV